MLVVYSPSFLKCKKSNALKKSTNNRVALTFFNHTPSMIRRVARICDDVDRFLWKAFLFFLRMFSISGKIWLRSKTLKTLAAFAVRVMTLYFLTILKLPFWKKRRIQSFVYPAIVFWLYASLHQRSMSLSVFV